MIADRGDAFAGGRGRQAPPSARHSDPAEPPGPAPRSGHGRAGGSNDSSRASGPSVDPELESDLGPEFALRGDQLESELEAARAEIAELRDRVLRGQAEFDNYRKRTMRERDEERKRATKQLVSELLPAIDSLERAIEHSVATGSIALSDSFIPTVPAGSELSNLITGVEAVHVQILAALGKEGVTIIDPLNEPFDPTTQQAVSQQEDPSVPEGTVTAVLQKGYSMGGLVIRHAMVVVSTGGPGGA